MKKLTTIQDVETFIQTNHLVFLYVSQKDCSVCRAIHPKVIKLLQQFPAIKLREVKSDQVKEIAAEYLVFSAPTLLFFISGKEYLREGKFVQFDQLESQLEQIYSFENKR